MKPNVPPPLNRVGSESRRELQYGMLMMILGMLLLPGMDAIVKGLSGAVS